jgi:2-oxo-4-hydroxy-4-carboxy--5-ureidoimidazoline (OHCU) decarboxylase
MLPKKEDLIMTKQEILKAIEQLPSEERLSLIKAALDLIGKDLQSKKPAKSRKKSLEESAKIMLNDYLYDKELTVFTAIDGDDFKALGGV